MLDGVLISRIKKSMVPFMSSLFKNKCNLNNLRVKQITKTKLLKSLL